VTSVSRARRSTSPESIAILPFFYPPNTRRHWPPPRPSERVRRRAGALSGSSPTVSGDSRGSLRAYSARRSSSRSRSAFSRRRCSSATPAYKPLGGLAQVLSELPCGSGRGIYARPCVRTSVNTPQAKIRLCEVALLDHRPRSARHGSIVRATGCFGTHVSMLITTGPPRWFRKNCQRSATAKHW